MNWTWEIFGLFNPPVSIVDPDFFKYRTKDNDAVKSVEGGLKVGGEAKGIHPHAWAGNV